MSKATPEEATKIVTDYMVRENRPYSATDVFNNLHREYGKTLITRCLDSAVDSGILREKTVSKQKIYFPNQDKLEICESAQMSEMDELISKRTAELATLNNEAKTLQNALKELEESLPTTELTNEIARLETQVKAMEEEVVNMMLNEDKTNIQKKDELREVEFKYKNEWRKRKRIALEMIGAIYENSTAPKKKLLVICNLNMPSSSEMNKK